MQENETDDALPGQDSFIDVVCNMVGILIVLVMILGVRSAGTDALPAPPVAANSTSLSSDVESGVARYKIAESCEEVKDAANRIQEMAVQSALTDARRNQLAEVLASVQTEIAQRRANLDKDAQQQFDVQSQIAAANIKLHELTRKQVSLLSDSATVEEIECVPTALARSLTGDVIHVRLAHGNLAVIPVDKLRSESLEHSRDYLRDELRRRDRAGGVFGPIDGFMMKLVLEMEDEDAAAPGAMRVQGSQPPTLREVAVFHPTSDDLGEPIEQALSPDSEFMQTLAADRAASQAILVWVYPNSFEELRLLKRAMWEKNMPMAVMPQPYGHAIFISSGRGTRPRAQ